MCKHTQKERKSRRYKLLGPGKGALDVLSNISTKLEIMLKLSFLYTQVTCMEQCCRDNDSQLSSFRGLDNSRRPGEAQGRRLVWCTVFFGAFALCHSPPSH